MKVEVLCTTMYQSGLDKYKEMNINTDVIFANQYNNYKYIENYINGNRVRMITTPYRGVGKNRNTALLYSNADILLFSDDDMVYFDNYKDNIIKAFEELPDADIIIFNIGSIGEKSTRRINKKIK
ncbi:glycosyltransferase family A protein [Clostridium perfringens]